MTTARRKPAAPMPSTWVREAREAILRFEEAHAEAMTRLRQAIARISAEETFKDEAPGWETRMDGDARAAARAMLDHVDEVIRPKGLMVRIELRIRPTSPIIKTAVVEVERVTRTTIRMRTGTVYQREGGVLKSPKSVYFQRIAPKDLTRVEAEYTS